ncbi:MAG: glycosyltransferase family 4 protein [Novosphingobium sp.]
MRLLHLHSSFHAGGKELRAARLINAFGPGVQHVIVSAMPQALGASAAVSDAIDVDYPDDFPSLIGKPLPGRLKRLAQAMQGFDLVLTYNWGAMDAVMAQMLFADHLQLPPLVHHEDGFNEDEAVRLKTSRNWYRRIALGRASALIVPSQKLEAIALGAWQQPRWRVRRIANGIATKAYGAAAKPDALPRLIKRKGELWLGTLAGLRAVKNLPRLVRAFSGLPDEWQLVILGEGPERDAIKAEAMRLQLGHRVHMPGFVRDPAKVIGLFDLFALSSDSEQFPLSVVEAMAAGLAVASPAVGDVAHMVAEANLPFIVPSAPDGLLAEAIEHLAGDPALRARLGAANQKRARAEFDEAQMIACYRQTYAEALNIASFP